MTTLVGFDSQITLDNAAAALGTNIDFRGRATGTITAGGALTTADRAKADGLTVLARIKGWGITGCDPTEMGLGPVSSIRQCLDRTGLKIADLDRVEINEAFSAQYLG